MVDRYSKEIHSQLFLVYLRRKSRWISHSNLAGSKATSCPCTDKSKDRDSKLQCLKMCLSFLFSFMGKKKKLKHKMESKNVSEKWQYYLYPVHRVRLQETETIKRYQKKRLRRRCQTKLTTKTYVELANLNQHVISNLP